MGRDSRGRDSTARGYVGACGRVKRRRSHRPRARALNATRMRHAGEFASGINTPFWLDKPVLAINTCIYWWSLRQNGIDHKIAGFGSLLLEH